MSKISVIVPVYNTPEYYLRNCINSLLNQTLKEIEIIIIDDGSEKWCANILDDYQKTDSRIKLFHIENGGVSNARNFGIEKATGEWMTFVDSDDWIELEMLETLYAETAKCDCDVVMWRFDKVVKGEKKETPFVGQDYMLFEGEEIVKLQKMLLNGYRYADTMLFTFLHTTVCKLYRSRLIKDNNISFPIHVRNGEDTIFTLKNFFVAKKIVFINKILYHYVQYEESITKGFNENTIQSWIENRKEFKKLLEEKECFDELIQEYDYHAIEVLKLLLFTVYAHPDMKDKNNFLPLKQLLRLDVFADSIKRVSLSNVYGMKSRIVAICAKLGLTEFLVILTKVRWKMISDRVV